MSERDLRTKRTLLPVRTTALALAVLVGLFGILSPALAQDSTPEADVLIATPADDATQAIAEETIANLLANLDDPEAVSALVTERLVSEVGGYASIEEALAGGFFADLPFAELETGTVTTYDDGRIGVDVQYWATTYQVIGETWFLIEEDSVWKIDSSTPGSVELDGDSAAVGVALALGEDGALVVAPNAPGIVETDILILQPTNSTEADLYLAVLPLDEGADPAGLLDGTIDATALEAAGTAVVPADGEPHELVLVALPAGQYALLAYDVETQEPIAVAPFQISPASE